MRTRPVLPPEGALLRTPRSRRRRASSSRSMPFVVKKRMLVWTSEGSIFMPGIVARPSARARALAWSSARRSTISSRATMPAAAMGAPRAGCRLLGGDHARRGDDARLAHAAADHAANAARLLDELAAAADEGA